MSLRAQALEADKSRKALQTAQDASGGSKRVRRCLMYCRRKGRRASFPALYTAP